MSVQVMKQNDVYGDGDRQSEDQVFELGKEVREKQKSNEDQSKGIDRIFVLPIKTP